MSLFDFSHQEIWFVTGSQHLYGPEALKQVGINSKEVADTLNASPSIPVAITYKTIGETPAEIRGVIDEANHDANCIGLIFWCHTFSPAKMWILGLKRLNKPFLHLHTQFYRDLPWSEIDMDYMNLHQAAHGDREFGFINARMRNRRKVVVGHWQDPVVQEEIGVWSRAARGWADWQGARFARFGDNMRYVSVTDGDKVSAESRFGYEVNGYGVGDLVECVNAAADADIDALCAVYEDQYEVVEALRQGGDRHDSLREGARIELGLRTFLEEGDFKGFTTTFEDLHGLRQLPGLAVQRLMADGYGFGAEGDWKACALLRLMKVMAHGQEGGTSFMEDYTYHLDPAGNKVLGAHMLEICETIADGRPSLEIHPLGIGGKEDPVRLVFNTPAGPAVNATIVDLGNRFRLVANEVEVVAPNEDLPRLPVARTVWEAKPNFKTSAACWILAGGSHHPIFSQAIGSEELEDLAEIAGIEYLLIDDSATVRGIKKELRMNEVYYHSVEGFSHGG